jgi:hypothetical protein
MFVKLVPKLRDAADKRYVHQDILVPAAEPDSEASIAENPLLAVRCFYSFFGS